MRLAFCVAGSAFVHVIVVAQEREPVTVLIDDASTGHGCGPRHEMHRDEPPEECEDAETCVVEGIPVEPVWFSEGFTSMRLGEDPELARELAIEAARAGSIFGPNFSTHDDDDDLIPKPRARTELELEEPMVFGGLRRRDIRRYLRYHAHEIARCNHAQLDRIEITAELLVGIDGDVRADASGGDGAEAVCVAEILRGISLPSSVLGGAHDPTRVVMRMTLRPRVERRYGTISNDPAGFVR